MMLVKGIIGGGGLTAPKNTAGNFTGAQFHRKNAFVVKGWVTCALKSHWKPTK